MGGKKFPLTIESDTLNAFKSDFNQMLRKLLSTMEQQEAEEGTLTAKIVVKLMKDQTRDYQTNGYDGTREITTPTFSHKVGIAMQFKDEKSGTLGGNYEMVWDKELNAYVMVEINNGQTSMFDEEEKERVVTAENADEKSESQAGYEAGKAFAQGLVDGMAEAKQLDGSVIGAPALPEAPPEQEGEIIEADYTDVSDEPIDEEKAEKIEEFQHAVKHIGEDLKILGSGGDLYSVRTIKSGSIFLTSAGTVKSSFHIDPKICAKHEGHELVCTADTIEATGEILRVAVKCIECDETIWALDNPELEPETDYGYDPPEE